MKNKYKKIRFELEVFPSFNVYSFFKLFKRIQKKGFFKDVVSVWRLEETGKKHKMKESHSEELREELFILTEEYGLK